MVGRLKDELQQTKPFETIAVEVFLNVLRTASVFQHRAHLALRPYGISHEQFNVLRILRGAGPEGCSCQQVADRMISHDPDITRLLDKLIARELVTRKRSSGDRRVIITRIGRKGLALLKRLERPMAEDLDSLVGHLSGKESTLLINLLERAREKAG